eukprot:3639389-Alexandrium_andersonii.AAC.1
MRRTSREIGIIFENVWEFGESDVLDLLSDRYWHIPRMNLCPTTLGWPSKRRRMYLVMLSRSMVHRVGDLDTFSEAGTKMHSKFKRHAKFKVSEYM